MKKCTKCGVEKPVTIDFFPKRDSSKDGFRNECKLCKKEYIRNYYENNREHIIKKMSITLKLIEKHVEQGERNTH